MIISASNISLSFKKINVLNNISIACDAGEICGVVGPNGAGKTSLFKILLGLQTPDTGEVSFRTTSKKFAGGIIEKPALYEYLNAFENLKVFAHIQGVSCDKPSLINMLQAVGLPIDRIDPVRNYSMGMKQRLGIAISLLNNPSCLILDEPFSGLDPIGISSLRELLIKLSQQGLAILISSHIMEEIIKTCDTLFVISKGIMLYSGRLDDVLANNTKYHTITARNLEDSKILAEMNCRIQGQNVVLESTPEMIPSLIRELIKEGIEIRSCMPEIRLEHFFTQTEI